MSAQCAVESSCSLTRLDRFMFLAEVMIPKSELDFNFIYGLCSVFLPTSKSRLIVADISNNATLDPTLVNAHISFKDPVALFRTLRDTPSKQFCSKSSKCSNISRLMLYLSAPIVISCWVRTANTHIRCHWSVGFRCAFNIDFRQIQGWQLWRMLASSLSRCLIKRPLACITLISSQRCPVLRVGRRITPIKMIVIWRLRGCRVRLCSDDWNA